MAKQDKNKDSLFLLEVLVDKIIFEKPILSEKDFKTCVLIENPNLEPLEICDDDCGTASFKKDGAVITKFNCGKSCLFSLKDNEISVAMSKFPIKATVYKCLPCGCLPEKIFIGEANIDMTKEFVQARNQFLQDPSNVSYEALKDSFRLHGGDGMENGEIWMFLRLSCFGKLIVTRFQGAGPRAFSTGTKGSNVDSSLPCNAGIGANAPCSRARSPYISQPCIESDDTCFCNGPRPTPQEPLACRNTDPYCLHVPKGRSKQFEEIGTTLCGNELKIKVPATSSVIKKISQGHLAMLSPYINKSKPDNPYPCVNPCAKNQISLAFPNEKTCCKGATPTETLFTCTTEGCQQVAKHGHQLARTEDDPKTCKNLDVFVLKVAKTALEGDRKCKIEMELVTPKGGDKPLPTQKANAGLQSDLDCAPQPWVLCQDLTAEEKKNIRKSFSSEDFDFTKYKEILGQGNATKCKGRNKESNVTENKELSIINIFDAVDHMEPVAKTNSILLLSSPNSKSDQTTPYESVTSASSKEFGRKLCQNSSSIKDMNLETNRNKETTVYMTLFSNSYCRRQTSGTQATGSLNKCLQVRPQINQDCTYDNCCRNMKNLINKNMAYRTREQPNPNIFYCSKFCKMYTGNKQKNESLSKKDNNIQSKAKGKSASKSSLSSSNKSDAKSSTKSKSSDKYNSDKNDKVNNNNYKKNKNNKIDNNNSNDANKKDKNKKNKMKDDDLKDTTTKKCEYKASLKKYGKGKSGKDKGEKNAVKGDMYAAVSHIIIGPRDPCPYSGREPCQGPTCIQARRIGADSEPVKVTNVTNSRRGVFELVIRKLNGAPLARNELMLEWSPPISKQNAVNCGLPCYFVKPCRPSRIRIACRKPKCRRHCKALSGRPSCSACCNIPCKPNCQLLCRPMCNQHNPCPPYPPCGSSPCLRPCPVGYRRQRRHSSKPKIKKHKKRVSPCHNRAYTCPVVRCRSVPCPILPPRCCSPAYTIAPRRCLSACRTRCCLSRCSPC